MPTEVNIHAFISFKQRRGWRACARYDGGGDTQLFDAICGWNAAGDPV
jgi:hypothetical protein